MDCSRAGDPGRDTQTRGQSVWKKESGHQQPSSHPRPLSFGRLLPERCPFAEKCQAHHIPPPHKGPPSAQLHHQTRANYVISPDGADGDPRMAGQRVVFKLSNNKESLIRGTLIVTLEINGAEECSAKDRRLALSDWRRGENAMSGKKWIIGKLLALNCIFRSCKIDNF